MEVIAYLVGIQCLEKIHYVLEKVHDFLLGRVVGVAIRVKCGNTGSMCLPFMFPEFFVRAVVGIVYPVLVHVA